MNGRESGVLRQKCVGKVLTDGLDGQESTWNAGDPGSIPGLGKSPEEEMATHSNIVAWRIPWTEVPSRLQSMGSHRIGHDWATNTLKFYTNQLSEGGGGAEGDP